MAFLEDNMKPNMDDIVIAMMGVTGSGKSSFIKKVTGCQDVVIGRGLASETVQIKEYRYTYRGINYLLVDTPGFDDTYDSNEKVATRIIEWLSTSFRSGTKLNGIVYLHRITDPRMSGSSYENLRMFRQLCGEEGLKNVVLATTFWDTVSNEDGERRENELMAKKNFWSQMITKGCKIARLDKGRSCCLRILEDIAKNNGKIIFQIQTEIVTEGRNIRDTAAARETFAAFEAEMEVRERRDREALRQERFREERKIEERTHKERDRIRVMMEEKQKKYEEDRRNAEYRARREEEAAQKRAKEYLEWQLEGQRRRQAEIEAEREAQVKLQEQEQNEVWKRYCKDYRCKLRSVKGMSCDKCRNKLHRQWKYYYHCCFCDGDDYNQCGKCGNCCPIAKHPTMKRRKTLDECVII